MSKQTELLTALLNGEPIEDFKPKSRMEAYLKNCCLACGCDGLPEPISESDVLMYQLAEKIANSGGGGGSGGGNGDDFAIGDGNTHLWISLPEGRTSPMVGVCPNGTVTVDWGDGTEPDVLTGTSTTAVKWTPNHQYAKAGDYVITLTVDGEMGFSGENASDKYSCILRYSASANKTNNAYRTALEKVEVGRGVTSIGSSAFNCCNALEKVAIHAGATSIGSSAFMECYALKNITIPESVNSIGGSAFSGCYVLENITIPESVNSIGDYAFNDCHALKNIVIPDGVTSIAARAFSCCYALKNITIPDSVTIINSYAFDGCYALENINIPEGVTKISSYAFNKCYALKNINIPEGVTVIGGSSFYNCFNLEKITIPNSVTSIDYYVFNNCHALESVVIHNNLTYIGTGVFAGCFGVKVYDFTSHTAVPTLSNTNAFQNISPDCEIRVPAALYDEWIAATNWATYASNIVAV